MNLRSAHFITHIAIANTRYSFSLSSSSIHNPLFMRTEITPLKQSLPIEREEKIILVPSLSNNFITKKNNKVVIFDFSEIKDLTVLNYFQMQYNDIQFHLDIYICNDTQTTIHCNYLSFGNFLPKSVSKN